MCGFCLVAANPGLGQFGGIWPASEHPRSGADHLYQCSSALWERLRVFDLDFPTCPRTTSTDFSGQWYTNGLFITNAAGWSVQGDYLAAWPYLCISNGICYISGEAWLRTPRGMGDCAAAALAWQHGLGYRRPWQYFPMLQFSWNGTSGWTNVAEFTKQPQGSGWYTQRVVFLHKEAPFYRLHFNTYLLGGTYGLMAIDSAAFESMLYRSQQTNLATIKQEISGILTQFLNSSVATSECYAGWLETTNTLPHWTPTGLLAHIGALSNLLDDTPLRDLAAESNGWRFMPAIFSNLIHTEGNMRWAGSTNATILGRNARGATWYGWDANVDATYWMASWSQARYDVEQNFLENHSYENDPGRYFLQRVPYPWHWHRAAPPVVLCPELTNWFAGEVGAPWGFSSGGLRWIAATAEQTEVTSYYDPASHGSWASNVTDQVTTNWETTNITKILEGGGSRFHGVISTSEVATYGGSNYVTTNTVTNWYWVGASPTGTVTNVIGYLNYDYRAHAVAMFGWMGETNSATSTLRAVDFYYKAGPPWLTPMVNGTDWDEFLIPTNEIAWPPDYPNWSIDSTNLIATFDDGGLEGLPTSITRLTNTHSAASWVWWTNAIGETNVASTNLDDWLPTWCDQPTTLQPARVRGWAVTNWHAVNRWDFKFK